MKNLIRILSIALVVGSATGSYAVQAGLSGLRSDMSSAATLVGLDQCALRCHDESRDCKAAAATGYAPMRGIERCNNNYNACRARCRN